MRGGGGPGGGNFWSWSIETGPGDTRWIILSSDEWTKFSPDIALYAMLQRLFTLLIVFIIHGFMNISL